MLQMNINLIYNLVTFVWMGRASLKLNGFLNDKLASILQIKNKCHIAFIKTLRCIDKMVKIAFVVVAIIKYH